MKMILAQVMGDVDFIHFLEPSTLILLRQEVQGLVSLSRVVPERSSSSPQGTVAHHHARIARNGPYAAATKRFLTTDVHTDRADPLRTRGDTTMASH